MEREKPKLMAFLLKAIALPVVFSVAYCVTTLVIKIKYGI
jgi:hypothetical protein